ncbi:tol-pal system-associated acyl-CoA thioesterase [Roseomonas marmotae]|uniref:Tol-pal system-associated acyl-CoA thioesterase n=1 Tax=Roseomonas marmotae TaxID=2768161 RepID=A0ABS3KJ26_9PROT|nr:tol-pal system-associated acyl-CoA thioesterase [Roseomonas marmotae]MBO1077012.1 tol-pal system-associated acyl-CoA thioesterase [Roseomonas marmotae]QTI78410.1 tol-pal system-associated acyl-CoA thioesterase [Roseomonas marmotae]
MGVHRWPVRVYFEDTDAGGIVYHANYLRWAERARTESFRAIDLPHQLMMQRHASLLVVRRIEVEYVAPARLDDSLIVETRVLAMRGASVDFGQAVLDEASGATRAVLKVGLVCVRAEGMRPAPIPEPWRSVLRDGMS